MWPSLQRAEHLRLKGKLTPALLQTLIREMKGSSH